MRIEAHPYLLRYGKPPNFFADDKVRATMDELILCGSHIDVIVRKTVALFGRAKAPTRSACGRYRKRMLEIYREQAANSYVSGGRR